MVGPMAEANEFDVNKIGKVVNWERHENADCDAAMDEPDALEGVLRRQEDLRLGERQRYQVVMQHYGSEVGKHSEFIMGGRSANGVSERSWGERFISTDSERTQ